MTKPMPLEEECLGDIRTVIAGSQFCDADAEIGDNLNLEREPDNPHDGHAIRIENEDFEKVGYVPKDRFVARPGHGRRTGSGGC